MNLYTSKIIGFNSNPAWTHAHAARGIMADWWLLVSQNTYIPFCLGVFSISSHEISPILCGLPGLPSGNQKTWRSGKSQPCIDDDPSYKLPFGSGSFQLAMLDYQVPAEEVWGPGDLVPEGSRWGSHCSQWMKWGWNNQRKTRVIRYILELYALLYYTIFFWL